MKRNCCTLALMAFFSLGLCKPMMVVAQVPPAAAAPAVPVQSVAADGNQNYGTFGNRTLGQPLVPAPSTFRGGIQTAPGGSFIGRLDGSPASAAPGPQNNTLNGAAQPALKAAISPQSLPVDRDAPELPSITNSAPLSGPNANAPEGTADPGPGVPGAPRVPAAPALGLTSGSAPPTTSTWCPASPQLAYARSRDLSDRLTEFARTKGLLFGPAIDVYVSNNVALIQGAVGTPSDSIQLATALAHEPEILRIDNRLVALRDIRARVQPHLATDEIGSGGQGPPGAGPQHAAGPNTGKTADGETKLSGGPISIINPATNTATLSYSLGGDSFTIPPGYRQDFHEDRAWAIRFSPGTNRDEVQYRLHTGLYTFTSTDHGWELYHGKLP
jgi:hypothetical protein